MPIAYYNEIDPAAAQWLRNLIDAGHIAPGHVDERSIEDVVPSDLHGYTQCHFFAGIGVWSYSLRRAGWPDSRPVWTGSCPCQPFSAAGKGAGFADDRHLWPAFNHLIKQCRPPIVFGEQVASSDGLAWIDLVLTDLEAQGYAAGAVDTCAAGFGAPHIRQRLYWVGHTNAAGLEGHTGDDSTAGWQGSQRSTAEAGISRRPGPVNGFWADADWLGCRDGKWRAVEPGTFPLVDGATSRVVRLRAYGNAINAIQAQGFIESVYKKGMYE